MWFKNRRAKDRKQKREIGDRVQKMSASDESDYEVSDDDDDCVRVKKHRLSSTNNDKTGNSADSYSKLAEIKKEPKNSI